MPRPKHALPDPWYRRPVVWGAVALVVVVVALVAWLLVGRGGGGDPFVEPDFNTTSSSTTGLPASCIDVANPSLLLTIAATSASAVETGEDDGWFVAKANGATWYTTADPTQDAAGELVPMNDQARIDSTSRRDVPPGDPLYNGHTDDEPETDAARSCAL